LEQGLEGAIRAMEHSKAELKKLYEYVSPDVTIDESIFRMHGILGFLEDVVDRSWSLLLACHWTCLILIMTTFALKIFKLMQSGLRRTTSTWTNRLIGNCNESNLLVMVYVVDMDNVLYVVCLNVCVW
jgi:hypothetical protein